MKIWVLVAAVFFVSEAQAEVCVLENSAADVYEDGNYQNRGKEKLKSIGHIDQGQFYNCQEGVNTKVESGPVVQSGSVWIAPKEGFDFNPKVASEMKDERQVYLDGDPGKKVKLFSAETIKKLKKYEAAKIRTLGAMKSLKKANDKLDNMQALEVVPASAQLALAESAVSKADANHRRALKEEKILGDQWKAALESSPSAEVGNSNEKLFVEDVETDALGIGHLNPRMYHRYKVRVEDKAGNVIRRAWVDAENTRQTSFKAEALLRYKEFLSEDITVQTQAAYCIDCHLQNEQESEQETGVEGAERQTAELLKLMAKKKQPKISKKKIIDHVDKNRCLTNHLGEGKRPLGALKGKVTKAFTKYRGSIKTKKMADSSRPTETELLMIDMLARTLWGEMRGGYSKRGLRYYKSVARIVMNRAEEAKSTGKVDQIHACPKSVKKSHFVDSLSCVLGTPNQFTMWGGNDVNFEQTYCIQEDIEEWKAAIAVASEAILSPDKFKRSTADLKGVRSYASQGERIKGLSPLDRPVFVDALPVDHGYTLTFWD